MKETRRHKKTRKKEKGCIEPLYGKIKMYNKIVPKEKKVPTFQMDKRCKKTRKLKNK